VQGDKEELKEFILETIPTRPGHSPFTPHPPQPLRRGEVPCVDRRVSGCLVLIDGPLATGARVRTPPHTLQLRPHTA
jgi:hypothetical protein